MLLALVWKASHPQKQKAIMMSQEATASLAADVTISACAWMLNAVIDINFHPVLIYGNSDITKQLHEYVRDIFEIYSPFIVDTMNGLNYISFSMSKDLSSLCFEGAGTAWPVADILQTNSAWQVMGRGP
jgi:hypothetical protein